MKSKNYRKWPPKPTLRSASPTRLGNKADNCWESQGLGFLKSAKSSILIYGGGKFKLKLSAVPFMSFLSSMIILISWLSTSWRRSPRLKRPWRIIFLFWKINAHLYCDSAAIMVENIPPVRIKNYKVRMGETKEIPPTWYHHTPHGTYSRSGYRPNVLSALQGHHYEITPDVGGVCGVSSKRHQAFTPAGNWCRWSHQETTPKVRTVGDRKSVV